MTLSPTPVPLTDIHCPRVRTPQEVAMTMSPPPLTRRQAAFQTWAALYDTQRGSPAERQAFRQLGLIEADRRTRDLPAGLDLREPIKSTLKYWWTCHNVQTGAKSSTSDTEPQSCNEWRVLDMKREGRGRWFKGSGDVDSTAASNAL